MQGVDYSYIILSTTGAIFVIPFLLFSSTSGTLADRFSKRDIIVLTKILELVAMAIGLLAFAFQSQWLTYFTLFLMATQSAIFGPSKYGILPEIVTTDKISKANGLMTSFTFLAIIIGTFLASFITDVTGKDFTIASLICVLISLLGVTTSFGIEYTPPAGSTTRFDIHFIHTIFNTLKFSIRVPSLLPAVLGSAYFLFLGAFMQLNIIPFSVQSLNLSDVQGGYLFLIIALGIGMGSVMAGKISGKTVELGLVPLSCLGITLNLFLLDYYSEYLAIVIPLIITIGMLGGMYQVPLDSYIQVASPHDHRGQVIAATNFLSFAGVLLASLLIYLNTALFHLQADKGFTMMGFLTIFVTIAFTFQFFDYLARFIGMILSKLHFKITFDGQDNIPKEAALYICTHTAWNDTLIILGSQRRRMRFFIEHEHDNRRFMRKLYRMLRVVFIPDIEPLNKNEECLLKIKKTLKKGISVCIFVDNSDLEQEIKNLQKSYHFREILEAEFPIIPVRITKADQRPSRLPLKGCFVKKFRVPASISFG